MDNRFKICLLLAIVVDGVYTAEPKSIAHTNFLAPGQLYLNDKENFIKLDKKSGEVEIELGVSIPIVKIPTSPEVGREDSSISVSGPGLLMAGALMLASYVAVPVIFADKLKEQKIRKNGADDGLNNDVTDNFRESLIHSRSCMESLICWAAKKSKKDKSSLGRWIEYVLGAEWLMPLVNGTFIEEAASVGRGTTDCLEKYPFCPITRILFSKQG